MAIDQAVYEVASESERAVLIAHDHEQRMTKAATWRYIFLAVFSIIPLVGVSLCLNAVAGKTTNIKISIVASLALTGMAGLALKVHLQRQELKRVRRRLARYETEESGYDGPVGRRGE